MDLAEVDDGIDRISIERAHCLGKNNTNGEKLHLVIAKFSFYKNKELALSSAHTLAGTDLQFGF